MRGKSLNRFRHISGKSLNRFREIASWIDALFASLVIGAGAASNCLLI
jgi:hypothetical protein